MPFFGEFLISDLLRMFSAFDKNDDGIISKDELRKVFTELGLDPTNGEPNGARRKSIGMLKVVAICRRLILFFRNRSN
jgi:hypothetical protein